MSDRYWIILVLALLAWSFYARKAYDFAYVVFGRIADRLKRRSGPQSLRMSRDSVVDRSAGQADEIAAYLARVRVAAQQSAILDSSSAQAFERGQEGARARLRQSLRYPPPGFEQPPTGAVVETVIGEDEFARYVELRIPVLDGLHSIGIYLRPRSAAATDKLPLVISAHGRGGMPPASPDGQMPGMARSPRDQTWHALKAGYAVWFPTFAHYNKEGDDFRDRLTVRAWEAGSSLPAIEIAKTVRTLDALLARPDIDADRVAMMGVSYGGFYTLYTSALEPRIRVAVVAAYFNDREAVLDNSEASGFLDWRFPDSLGLWRDPSVAALVAPRPLLVVSGNQDQLFPIEGARKAAPEVAQLYARLGIAESFVFKEFAGRHDFNGEAAMDFIVKKLGGPAGR